MGLLSSFFRSTRVIIGILLISTQEILGLQPGPSAIKLVYELIKEQKPDFGVTVLEVGARPIQGKTEPYWPLLEASPNNKLVGIEPDEELCANLNKSTPANLRYYPIALGDENTEKTFYETQSAFCSSLYEPDEEYLNYWNGLQHAMPKKEHKINVVTFDSFSMDHKEVGDIDLIKIDIQGAELDVFKGASEALKSASFIVSEVEFVALYKDQPLFGDVCAYLSTFDLDFHKFVEVSGRTLKPMILANDVTVGTQHMWADVAFVPKVTGLANLSDQKLLSMALFSFIYGSPDQTYHALGLYDQRNGSELAKKFANLGQGK